MFVSDMSVSVLGSARPCISSIFVTVPGSVPLSMSMSAIFVFMLGLAALSSAFGVFVLMPRLSTPLSVLSISGVSVLVFRSLTLLFILFMSDMSVLVSRLLAFLFACTYI